MHKHTNVDILWILTLCDTEICNIKFFDHMPVLFEFILSCQSVRSDVPKYRTCMITSEIADCFVCSNKILFMPYFFIDPSTWPKMTWLFCLIQAPWKALIPLVPSQTISLVEKIVTRELCRKAEQKWTNDRHLVSFDVFTESLLNYQKAVRAAKTKYSLRSSLTAVTDLIFYLALLTQFLIQLLLLL